MNPQLWRLEYLRREGEEREQDVEGGEDRSKIKIRRKRMWEEEMQNRKEEEERM